MSCIRGSITPEFRSPAGVRTLRTPRRYDLTTPTSIGTSGLQSHGKMQSVLLTQLSSAQRTGTHADITFTFANTTEQVKAHKLILALRSTVFNTMFYGDPWSVETDVEITEIAVQVFKMLIEFLYSNSLPQYIPVSKAIDLLYAATKYSVDDLIPNIKAYLTESIGLETVLPILKAAMLFVSTKLESRCWEYIEMDTTRIILTDEFINLDENLLSKILDMDSLNVPEIQLFEAVTRWGEAKCLAEEVELNNENLRRILDKLLKKIRFPTMSATEIADCPAISELLSMEEVYTIFLTKFSNDKGKAEHPTLFPTKVRAPKGHCALKGCQCNPRSACLFCRNRNCFPENASSDKSLNMFQTPIPYCRCKTQGYCRERKFIIEQ